MKSEPAPVQTICPDISPLLTSLLPSNRSYRTILSQGWRHCTCQAFVLSPKDPLRMFIWNKCSFYLPGTSRPLRETLLCLFVCLSDCLLVVNIRTRSSSCLLAVYRMLNGLSIWNVLPGRSFLRFNNVSFSFMLESRVIF